MDKDNKKCCNEDNSILTTNEGVAINDDGNSLTVGANGPTLLEDVQFIEKMAHFDRERIPERVVHAKGAGAHGYFEVKHSMKQYTKAKVFDTVGKITPLFTRFSEVVGSKGSADTARDPRGFAVKFYTEDGNYDIAGNDIPVFFIRDAIKFPDMVHAFKPAPNSNTHDANRFWDFISSNPESTHMITWVYSDLGTVKSYRTLCGSSVNTYVWVDDEGHRRLVKYHWEPLLGVKTIDRHEAERLAGSDPDVAVNDLYDALERGEKVQYDLSVQIIEYNQVDALDFNPEDPTKTWPEDQFPQIPIGTMTLDRNPSNYFLETEQIAFCPATLVPGVELSNDKLLQGRSFAYHDTQRYRLGANFTQIPINMPKVPVNNNQQDGSMRMSAKEGPINYDAKYNRKEEKNPKFIEGNIVKQAITKNDDFAQAGARYRGLSDFDRDHLIDNIVSDMAGVKECIQRRAIANFTKADEDFGRRVRVGLELQ